jgi:hypothetical protein
MGLACAVAAVVSVLVQGFQFGEGNNVFHIPLVLDWRADPQFAEDTFIQSLRYFVSNVWPFVRPLTTESNIYAVFLVLHVTARWLILVGVMLGLRTLVSVPPVAQVALPFWFGLLPAMLMTPAIGEGEILVHLFTHSEIALALMLFTLVAAAHRKLVLAFALTGLVAEANAFMAVWTGVAMLGVVAAQMTEPEAEPRVVLKQTLIGAVAAFVLALPIAYRIISAMQSQPEAPAFDYVDYLREYFPFHTLIDATLPRPVMYFVGIASAGLAALWWLGATARTLRWAYVALCGLFVVGVVLPALTHAPLLLNLNLLRAASFIQLLAVIGLTAAALTQLQGAPLQRLAGALALVMLALPVYSGVFLAGIVLLISRFPSRRVAIVASIGTVLFVALTVEPWPRRILQLTVAAMMVISFYWVAPKLTGWRWLGRRQLASLVALALAIFATEHAMDRRALEADHVPEMEDLREIAVWTRDHTPIHATFLVPVIERRLGPLFQTVSRRRIWVEWTRGAAVMWMPSYYPEWSQRMAQVEALPDTAARITYACANQIDYVLDDAEERPPLVPPVAANAHWQLFDVRAWCEGRTENRRVESDG